MEIIPVVDLLGGQVVHARRGERHLYRPIRSQLAEGSDPCAIVGALVTLAPFRTLYVADLDAIAGRRRQDAVIVELRQRFPALDLWVDAGETTADAVAARARAGAGTSVVGSESFREGDSLSSLFGTDYVLSLDHDAGGTLGPARIHAEVAHWPARIIAMTLARVGAGTGPDLERLAAIRRRAGARAVFAAGGVRGRADIEALAEAGAAGVLVATALHDGTLGVDDLARFGPAQSQGPFGNAL